MKNATPGEHAPVVPALLPGFHTLLRIAAALLQRTGDPLAPAFARRDKPEILAAARQTLREQYERPPRGKAKAKTRKMPASRAGR